MKTAVFALVGAILALPSQSQTLGEGMFVEPLQVHFAAGVLCQTMGLQGNVFLPYVEVLEAEVTVEDGGVGIDAVVRENSGGPDLIASLSIDPELGMTFVCEYKVTASPEDTQVAWGALSSTIRALTDTGGAGVTTTTIESEFMEISQCTYAYDIGLEWVAHMATSYIRDSDERIFSSVTMLVSDQYPPCTPEPR